MEEVKTLKDFLEAIAKEAHEENDEDKILVASHMKRLYDGDMYDKEIEINNLKIEVTRQKNIVKRLQSKLN